VPRILIVEDDQSTLAGLEALLTSEGYTVQAARSVPAGLQALRTSPPDLLIADIRVEGYNGLQLVVDQAPPVKAIFITGYPDPVLEAEARQMGAEFLLKPISPRKLLDIIAARLGVAPPAAEATTTVSDADSAKSIRRWPRKVVPGDFSAQIAASRARIVDVSYGGLRIAIDATRAQTLPPSFNVTVPSPRASLDVDLVWKAPQDGDVWLCGLAVAESDQPAWRELIDQFPWQAA
jgi:DNA-binding response OmpR family regulator